MEKEILGQEPAFAYACSNEETHHIEIGMSKRFYAACAAMQGILAYPYSEGTMEQLVEYAYKYADELLKQENL